ncbi:MAG: TetR/AcrR family transcriptional regulator [Gammaproteobacteria bacterium]|nr:TetR/AcrR family transcriptional regulator [Gammaproteobacteria bacterium]
MENKSRTTSRTSKGTQTRARILSQARGILVREGYDDLVMRELATSGGMTLGNLQYYFATKETLVTAIIEAEGLSDLNILREAYQNCGDPKQALRTLVHSLVEKWRGESGAVFSTLNFLAMHKPAYRGLQRSIYQAFHRELEEAIECVIPNLPKQVYKDRARVLTALIDGAAQQPQIGPKAKFFTLVADAAIAIALPAGGSC